MNADIKILIVDDEKPIRESLSDSLQDDGYTVDVASDGAMGLEKLALLKPHVVFLDVWMPGKFDGIDVITQARDKYPQTDFIVMSGHANIETAVKATKLGAWDFIEKPLSMEKISILLTNVINFQQERHEKNALLNRLRRNIALIGDSEPMKDLKELVSKAAPAPAWVLITGENGTGKELVAQNIHYLSHRASRPFVDVNCAALPDELIESELFGYEKGAFTGALAGKKGKFDLAHGGTLFLDEIADMSLKTQAKILRVLQEKKFERVGGVHTVEVDVRVIAATNKNLKEEIESGRFREDLFHRLNVLPFRVPTLRERLDDVASLVIHFCEQFVKEGGYRMKRFSPGAIEALKKYNWPGNVRELRNFVERIFILVPGEKVESEDLKLAGLRFTEEFSPDYSPFQEANLKLARAQFEREFISRKLDECNGNISKTAEVIGLERSHLHRKMKTYGLNVKELTSP